MLIRAISCLVFLLALHVPCVAAPPAEVSFENGGVTLRGTLFSASGPGAHPAVIILAGSGKAPRDEPMFHVLERRFTALGLDVLAFDKRGSGKSGGTYDDATTVETLAGDGLAAVRMLQARSGIDPKRVGVWGISEGGWVGPLMASQSSDVAFVLTVSGPGVSIAEQGIYLRAGQMLAKGYSLEDAQNMINMRRVLWAYYGTGLGRDAAQNAATIFGNEKWFKELRLPNSPEPVEKLDPGLRSFMEHAATYDPLQVAQAVHVPALVVFGAKDSLSPPFAGIANLMMAYKKGGNTRASFALIPDAGHGLQRVRTKRECHQCDEQASAASGEWDAAPGYLELQDRWLLENVVHPAP